MRQDLEAYRLADPLFFDTPSRWERQGSEFHVATQPAPPGWRRVERDIWVSLTPASVTMPPQGWKIHVGAGADNAERVLTKTWEYCAGAGVAFKFLCSPAAHRATNLKYASRAASGKLVTIYPPDEAALRSVLTELSAVLADEPSPYILSDLRYGGGPLYVRYGGFVSRYCVADDGELVYAIERPDGHLVPDRRQPVFTVPSWVHVPDFLQPHLAARTGGGVGDWPYQVESALHFSNGGGVYRARRRSDGREVVLKEARPLAGLDRDGRDAVSRLRDETEMLRRLQGIPGVPELYEKFTLWEHHFLAMEAVPGDNLQTWLAREYPFTRCRPAPELVSAYAAQAQSLLAQLEAVIAAIHDRGVVFGDLHPANVMVGPDGRVWLVDFEMASDAADQRAPTAGYPGFIAWHKRGEALDHHALAILRLWLMLPLTSMLALAPAKADSYLTEIERRFPLPAGYGDPVREALRPLDTPVPGETVNVCGDPPVELAADWQWPAVRESIVGGILAAATPARTDRLFPGDPQQFLHDPLGLAYGAAGVLWALSVTDAGRFPEYERWLLVACERSASPRPGLLDGAAGLAYVLDHFGQHELADRLLSRAREVVPTLRDVSLFSGLAGVGLTLLHFAQARGSEAHLTEARSIADQLIAAVRSGAPHGVDVAAHSGGARNRDAGTRGGLLRGWSGVALFLTRCHETLQWLGVATGDAGLLAGAAAAIHRDLALCVTHQDGSWQVDGGYRTLPYLEIGSAGIAMAAAEYRKHVEDAQIQEAIPRLAAACSPDFVLEPSLTNGRAGLIAALEWLRRTESDPVRAQQLTDDIHRQRRLLSWHAVSFQGRTAFPGSGLWRLSMDVATGGGGVLLALSAVENGTPVLPLIGASAPRPGSPERASALAAT